MTRSARGPAESRTLRGPTPAAGPTPSQASQRPRLPTFPKALAEVSALVVLHLGVMLIIRMAPHSRPFPSRANGRVRRASRRPAPNGKVSDHWRLLSHRHALCQEQDDRPRIRAQYVDSPPSVTYILKAASDLALCSLARTAMTGRSMASQYSGTRPRGVPLSRTITSSKQRGFGGFPTPVEIASSLITKAFPKVQERLSRTMTVPRTSTIASTHSLTGAPSFRSAPYLSFDVTVSRNSRFHELTEAQREELGGVEYRAIDMLAKLIPGYWLFMNFFMITLVAPYLASAAAKKYRKNAFDEQEPHAPGTTW